MIEALAHIPGLTTADKIAPPPPRPVERSLARLTPEQLAAWDALAPDGLSLIATPTPVTPPERLTDDMRPGAARGGNLWQWPWRVVTTADRSGAAERKAGLSPFAAARAEMKLRVWCPTRDERDRLAASVGTLLATRAEESGCQTGLEPRWFDQGPDLDLALFEMEVYGIAEAIGVRACDDDALWGLLDRAARRVLRASVSGIGLRDRGRSYQAAVAREVEAMWPVGRVG